MIEIQPILGHWVYFGLSIFSCFCLGHGGVRGGSERHLLNSDYGKGRGSLMSVIFLYFFDAG